MNTIKDKMIEFLAKKPLYVKVNFALPEYPSGIYPDKAFFFCHQCGIERPFTDPRPRGSGAGMPSPKLESGVYVFLYSCNGCSTEHYYWIEVNSEEAWIRKVGQLPAWDIDLSPDLEQTLGNDAGLYKRGLICLSQGYGLAACIYMRRILENQISQILQLLYELQCEEKSNAKTLSEIKKLMSSKNAEKKLATAYKYTPTSIYVDGINPLKFIYDNYSIGIHGLNEDECSDVAQKLATSSKYILLR